jgi:hypothetical protein
LRLFGRRLHLRAAGSGTRLRRGRFRRKSSDRFTARIEKLKHDIGRRLGLQVVIDDCAARRIAADGRIRRQGNAAALHAISIFGFEEARLHDRRTRAADGGGVGHLMQHRQIVEHPEGTSLRGRD